MGTIDILNGLRQKQDGKAPSYHTIYATSVEENDSVYLNLDTLLQEIIEKDDFLNAWKCSENYIVMASQEAEGYNPQPFNVEDIDLDVGLEELTKTIAKNAHDIWTCSQMDEDWTIRY